MSAAGSVAVPPVGDPGGAIGRVAGESAPGFDPVFIMGPHRSGTTILYSVLAATGRFNVTTAYHVLNRDRLAEVQRTGRHGEARAELSALFDRLGLRDREFDSLPISPDLPEEYAWVLPRPGRKPRLTPDNTPAFVDFCSAVVHGQHPDRPLLLKNPHDAANFLYLREAFPRARFVFIHRDPVEVVNSQVKAVRSLLERKNEYVALVVPRYRRLYDSPARLRAARWLFSPRLGLLVSLAARTVRSANHAFMRHGDRLGAAAFGITYPDLCARPAETIGAILRFLELPEEAAADVASAVGRRDSPLLGEVRARRQGIRRHSARYCERFGFPC